MKLYHFIIFLIIFNISPMEEESSDDSFSFFWSKSTKSRQRTPEQKEQSAKVLAAFKKLRLSDSMQKKLDVTGAYMDDVFNKYKNPRYKKP